MFSPRKAAAAIAVLLLATAFAALSTAARAETATGVDCHTPLDPVTPFLDLSDCNLKGVTIDGNVPVLGGSPLYGANLSGANLMGATVVGGYKPLQFANLTGANLSRAILGGGFNELAVLQSADLTDANLNRATISGFRALSATNLTGANLHGASITGVEALQDAVYSDTTCPDGTNSDNDGGTCIGHGVP